MGWNQKVPFDAEGNVLHYAFDGHTNWKTNYEFNDDLIIQGYQRGQSAAYFLLQSENNGKEYPMFISDFTEMIMNSQINKGKVKGLFTFCKKGRNFGIKYLKGNLYE